MKAIRIHEDGGPEVLRYEDAPDPVPGAGEVLIELCAASLNHLDIWVRKGLPSVPKPRILGADGAGIVVSGVGFAAGDRVVINPGLDHGDGRVTVIGEREQLRVRINQLEQKLSLLQTRQPARPVAEAPAATTAAPAETAAAAPADS